MSYFLFIIILIALHFPIYKKRIKGYVFMFSSLFLIITLHIRFIYSLVPEYWININDKVDFYGPSTYYFMSMVDLSFYAFIVSWLTISLLILIELILNKVQKTFIKSKTIQIVNSFIVAISSIYFLMYSYFIDEFINSVNRPGFEFTQHAYLFFADVLLFILVIQLTWYRKNNTKPYNGES